MTVGPWRSNAEPLQSSGAVFSREFLQYLAALAEGSNGSAQDIEAIRTLLQDSGLTDISELSGVGLVVKREGGLAVRTITGSTRVGVTNGSGVHGNPIVDLRPSGVTADTYGSATEIPVLTVDQYGRVTLASVESAAGGASPGQLVFGTGDRINNISEGPKAVVPVTYDGNITGVQTHLVTSDGLAGSVVVDIRKCSYADYSATRPDAGDSICASAPPTVSTALKSQDTTLTGWTVAFVAGEVFLAYVVSKSSNVTHAVVAISIEKTP